MTVITDQDFGAEDRGAVSTFSRRRWLRFGTLGLFGAGALGPGRSVGAGPGAGARACILVFYQGGPSHLDTWDMKPKAPAEVRGEFRPIATAVPGLWVCEHLPHLARVADRLAVIRGVHHGMTNHLPAAFATLCGRGPLRGDQLFVGQDRDDPPSLGSAVGFARPTGRRGVPPFVALPYRMWNERDVPGQSAGLLGPAHEPLQVEADPNAPDFRLPELEPPLGVSPGRMGHRDRLLTAVERGSRPAGAPGAGDEFRARALDLLRHGAVRRAFHLGAEDPRVRDRYGRTTHGQSLLLARRLVEAGVRFVAVYDRKVNGPESWDTHGQNFRMLKDELLPPADRGLSALIEDLETRGLLDSTLVLALGEFGRSPQVNGAAGRDHWPFCYSAVLAGAGVRAGVVHGSSDKVGAYPDSDPVTPADLAATLLWRLGIDPTTEVRDPAGRPYPLAEGRPLRELYGMARST